MDKVEHRDVALGGYAQCVSHVCGAMKKAPHEAAHFDSCRARCARTARWVRYQIFTGSLRTISVPGLHWNALANCGMLLAVAKARISGGACGSVLSRNLASFLRMVPSQTRAELMKKRCSGVKPPIFLFSSGFFFSAICKAV